MRLPLLAAVAALLMGCSRDAREVAPPSGLTALRASASPAELPPIVGSWRGTEKAADQFGEYRVEAVFEFRSDGSLSADMDFPEPILKQHYSGEYKFLAEDRIEITLDRWGKTARKFVVVFGEGQMTLTDEKGEDVTFTRVK